MEPSQEQELLAGCRGGDAEAFSKLVVFYEPKVRGLARRLVGDEHLADDLSQQAFLNAFEALRRFRGESRFSTWLYRITVNVCGMHLRRQKVQLWDEPEEPERIVNRGPGPTDLADQTILRERLEKALPRLPWPQRQAISLFYLEGVAYPQIAEILDVPLGTVKAWISRGLARLRQNLCEEKLR